MNFDNEKSFMRGLRQAWNKAIRRKEGAICPCCDRFGKVYARSINNSMATTLRWMYDYAKIHGSDTWINMRTDSPIESVASCEYARLVWWHVIEKKPIDVVSKKKSTGIYRITKLGIDFIEGRALIPKNIFLHNDELLGESEEMTDFVSCLKDSFDYQKLMQSEVSV
jgi:hypothetical protein